MHPTVAPTHDPARRHCRRPRRSGAAGLLAALALGAGLHAPVDAKAATDPVVAGEIVLRLRTTAALPALLARHRLSLRGQFGARPIYRLGVVGGGDAGAVVEALLADASVISAEANSVHRSPEARGSTAWTIGTAASFTTQWAPAALRLAPAHALSTGAGTRVAVLDTGVDAAHPALAGRLLPGFDFVDFDPDPAEVGHPATHPSFGHGTHVAGIVALVAPGARILPLRVLDADGAGHAWVLAEAMLHALDPDRNPATDDGAHVINMSLGSFNRTRVFDALARLAACEIPAVPTAPEEDFTDPGFDDDRRRCAARAGAVVVAAAGNDASAALRQYPAAEGAYGLVSVAATNDAGALAAFSNGGNWIRVAAPGEGITSAVPGGGWGTWSGTSMAAPMASGVAALLRAREPATSARDLARRLARSAGVVCGSKLPRLDALAALQAQPAPPTPCP